MSQPIVIAILAIPLAATAAVFPRVVAEPLSRFCYIGLPAP